MSRWWCFIVELMEFVFMPRPKTHQARVTFSPPIDRTVQPRPPRKAPLLVTAKKSASPLVPRSLRFLWQERGWVERGNSYEGYFRTRYGAYQGKIVEPYAGYFSFFIMRPPACLKRHPHARCFIPKGDSLYEIHFSPRPTSPDAGIMAAERVLTEAHQL